MNEDGGNRQCVLVTNNENNICEEVTFERNKRVIEGYTTSKSEKVEGLTNNNLRYYKIDFKERKQSHQSNRELFHEMKDLLCIKEDIYQEQNQFGSLSLKGKERMIRYFAENGREMLMVYDTRVIPFIVKEIEKMSEKEQPLKIYIFADGAYPYTDDFATVIDKVSLVPMPYAYYRGIKDSLPDVEPKKEDNTELTDEEQKQMMAEAIEAENNEKKED
jgi:adenine-specific DNA-methyltransferase